MNIEFKKVSEFHRGILFALLKDAYSYHSEIERTCGSDWQNGDNFFFDHLHLADKCGFITTLHGEAIGFISWNPSQSPEYVELGNNCIKTKWIRKITASRGHS